MKMPRQFLFEGRVIERIREKEIKRFVRLNDLYKVNSFEEENDQWNNGSSTSDILSVKKKNRYRRYYNEDQERKD